MISRPYLFLLFLMLGFFTPLLFFRTSMTFIVVVPCTLMIWFIAGWREIVEIKEMSNLFEVLLGAGIYALNILRNAVGFLESFQGIGLYDMLFAFISVCIAFYGFKGLKHFILPTAYLSVLIVGYHLEFTITEVVLLENWLANLIASMLNFVTISAFANGNIISLNAQGGPFLLAIDAPCTGIKGILAYGSLAVLMILDVKTTYKRKALCTAIGLIGTFLVNILRLLAIFLACYFFGMEAALAVHAYLGYGLFIIWVFLFWTIAFKYMLRPAEVSCRARER